MGSLVPIIAMSATAAANALSAQSDWTQLVTPGAPFRYEEPLAYDLTRARTFMFGGNPLANDLWSYDGQSWIQVATQPGPSPRRFAVLVADPVRGELLLFGGTDITGVAYGDTWTWNSSWTQRQPATSPPGRYRAAATYDFTRGLVLVFGGQGLPFLPLGDHWQWDGSSWTQVTTAAMPPGRGAAGLAYDIVRDRSVLFGGYSATNQFLGDTWEWDGLLWRQRTGQGPGARMGSALVFDWQRQRTLLTGGFPFPLPGGPWEWDGDRWAQIATTSQPLSQAHWGIAYDIARQRTVLYGSYGGTDTWEYGNRFAGHSTTLGHGCASGGVPVLGTTAGAWPQVGGTFPLQVTGLRPATTVVIAGIGRSRTQSPFGLLPLDLTSLGLPGCLLFTDSECTFGIAASSGTATYPLAVPNDTSLRGFRLFVQVVQPEPGAPLPASLSNALELVIG
jgi:hypothetical protein